jgi:lantibiotic modifying enzyme
MHEGHGHPLSRRSLIAGALGAAGALALHRDAAAGASRTTTLPESDLDVALRAERWIRSARVTTEHGTAWPSDPLDPGSVVRNLYTGTPGVVLFLLELHAATGDAAVIEQARAGADDLAATLPATAADVRDAGLYTGLAGIAYTLAETWRSTRDDRYRREAERAIGLIRSAARPAGAGIEWSDSADIISGGSGIALSLLWSADALGDASLVDLAARAGRRLAELGKPANGGLKWAISPSVAQLYPNFSHGTAGVGYTLATLHGRTGERPLLDAALAGATYLDAVTDRSGGGCKVFHHESGGEQLFYLSWCHGGAGTARFYHRLAEVTGDRAWRERIGCLAKGITDLGAPVERTPGYWNNISQCCGSAGVGEFFLSLERLEPGRGHLQVARRAAEDIVNRASASADGSKWVQAEHRVRPDLLVAQTGFMQGAAGVGTFLLHLDAHARGRAQRIVLPDSPFA